MIITIKEKDYEPVFGLGFIRRLDEKYGKGSSKYGAGFNSLIVPVLNGSLTALSDLLLIAVNDSKLKQADIDDFLDHVEDIDAFYTEVQDELKKQNATRILMKTQKEREDAIMNRVTASIPADLRKAIETA